MCYRILRDDGTYDHAELHVVDTYDEALAYSKEYKEGSTSHERMTIEEIPATSAAEYLLNRATKNGEDADDVKLLRAVHEQQTPKKKAMDEKGGSDAQR